MTNLMTPEQYAADERNVCPCCHSEHGIEGDSIEIDGLEATQEVGCSECSSDWFDTYKRTGYVIEELGSGIDAPKLTPEQYAVAAPNLCPCCGRDAQIEGRSCTVDGRTMSQNVSCFECNSYWSDTYERTGYSEMNAGTPLADHVAFLQIKAPRRATRAALVEAIRSLIEAGQSEAEDSLEDDGLEVGEAGRLGARMEAGEITVARLGAAADAAMVNHVVVIQMMAPQGAAPDALSDSLRQLIEVGQADAHETLDDGEGDPETKLCALLETEAVAVALKEAA